MELQVEPVTNKRLQGHQISSPLMRIAIAYPK